jgi:hypothetical protein
MSATMEWAIGPSGDKINATAFVGVALRRREQVTCLCCEEVVTPKAGDEKTPHYAHRRGSSCALTNPETAAHFNAKMHVAAMLGACSVVRLIWRCPDGHATAMQYDLPDGHSVEVERAVESRRPDVLVTVGGAPWLAVEVLHTHAVDDEKAADLDASVGAWIEVRAADALAWDGAELLRPTRLCAEAKVLAARDCVWCERAQRAEMARAEAAAKHAETVAQRARDALAWLNAEIARSREEEQWATSARLRTARERRRKEIILASPPSWNIAVGVAVNGHRGRAVVAVLSMAPGKRPHVCEVEEATTGGAAWHAIDHALSLVVPTGRAVVIHTTFDTLDRANFSPSPWESDEIKTRVNHALRDTKSVVVCTKYDHPTMGQWMHAASRAARAHLDGINESARAEEAAT